MVNVEGVDRWDFATAGRAMQTRDRLGDHTAARYRYFRRYVEKLDSIQLNHMLFGLLLSVESMRDELRGYEEQASALVRLAQTGHYVRQLQRLNGVLDMERSLYGVLEPASMKAWKSALEAERAVRMERYNVLLQTLRQAASSSATRQEQQGDGACINSVLNGIQTDTQREESLTLLSYTLDKYRDVLTPAETQMTKEALDIVSELAGVEVMPVAPWFVPSFEFSSTYGLSRWGNELFIPDFTDQTRFVKDASLWSTLNHPHIAKFLGASHVGSRPFIVHEKLRPLRACLSDVKDRRLVWRRFYEVALCLQYLNARGLAFEELRLEDVYCLEFEDKAVLRRIGLAIRTDHKSHDETLRLLRRMRMVVYGTVKIGM